MTPTRYIFLMVNPKKKSPKKQIQVINPRKVSITDTVHLFAYLGLATPFPVVGNRVVLSWQSKGTRDPMPRLPPRNKALIRPY